MRPIGWGDWHCGEAFLVGVKAMFSRRSITYLGCFLDFVECLRLVVSDGRVGFVCGLGSVSQARIRGDSFARMEVCGAICRVMKKAR